MDAKAPRKGLARLVTSSEALLLLMVVIWGVMFPIVKQSLREISPLAFAGVRYVLAALALVLFQMARRQRIWVDRRDTLAVVGLGLLGYALYPIAFVGGLAFTSANNASMILAGTPVVVAILASVFGFERHGWRGWLGVASGFFGIATIVWASQAAPSHGGVRGDLLALAATLLWSIHTVFIRPLLKRYSSMTLTTAFMVLGAPVLALVALAQVLSQDWRAVSAQAWGGLLYAGVVAGALAYLLWNLGVERVGSTRTAAYYNLAPVVTVATSWVMLGERLGLPQFVGGAAIIGGIFLAQKDPKAVSESRS
jgi:drug/metabolite transporter (DMT)-like permease